jgi:hypothetical protein
MLLKKPLENVHKFEAAVPHGEKLTEGNASVSGAWPWERGHLGRRGCGLEACAPDKCA